MVEQTLMLIKPDGVQARQIGEVVRRVEAEGFRICGMKMLHLQPESAGSFYAVHRDKSFFNDLIDFMTSGPIVALAVEREDAVSHLRKFVGDTNPVKAVEGTIRRELGSNKQENVVHASDSLDNAEKEISFFFGREDLV